MYGRVKLTLLPDSPTLIKELCDPDNNSSSAKQFKEFIVALNTALAFGSLSAGTQLPPGRGPPVVMMNGQQSQQIGNLRPPRDEQGQRMDPLFGQVYVLDDVEAATNVRMRTSSQSLPRGLLRQLEKMVRELNPYATRLSSLGQQLERAERGESVDIPPPQYFRLSILDTRPAPGQVFAVFDARDNSPPDPNLSGIYLYSEGGLLQKIAIWNKNGDWILFPMMFPTAVQTYGPGIPRNIDIPAGEVLLPADDAVLLSEIVKESEFKVRVVDSTTQTQQSARYL